MRLYKIIESSPSTKVIIASSRPKSFKIGAELIKLYQKTNFSHVLVIINGTVFQASNLKTNTYSIKEFLKHNEIVEKFQIDKSMCDFKFLFSVLGRPYGIGQIIKITLKYLLVTKVKIIKSIKFKDNGDQYLICSEYVGKFLKLSWVNDFTSPGDIITYLKKSKEL